jgi:hypothetical protein
MTTKLGRKSKGDRDTLIVRVPRAIGDRVRSNAEDLGISIVDYVTTILARDLAMPEHAPTISGDAQLALPLDRRLSA